MSHDVTPGKTTDVQMNIQFCLEARRKITTNVIFTRLNIQTPASVLKVRNY